MSNVQPWTQPIRNRVSPGSRAGSAIARSFSPAFDRHGLRVEDDIRRELEREVVAIDDVHPIRKPRPKRVTSAPTPTRASADRDCPARGRSGHEGQDDRGSVLASPSQKSSLGVGIVEQVAGAQDRVHAVASADVEDRSRSRPSARATASSAPPRGTTETAARGASRPCAGASARRLRFGGAIRNDTWNSRVTVGARYRSS